MTAGRTAHPSVDARAVASPEGATTPRRCPTCQHVTVPARRCECGHIEEMHHLPEKSTTRKACSVSGGRKATPCGCRLFTPELPEGLPND